MNWLGAAVDNVGFGKGKARRSTTPNPAAQQTTSSSSSSRPQTPNHRVSAGRALFADRMMMTTRDVVVTPGQKKRGRNVVAVVAPVVAPSVTANKGHRSAPATTSSLSSAGVHMISSSGGSSPWKLWHQKQQHQVQTSSSVPSGSAVLPIDDTLNHRIARIERTLFESSKPQKSSRDRYDDDGMYHRRHRHRSRSRSRSDGERCKKQNHRPTSNSTETEGEHSDETGREDGDSESENQRFFNLQSSYHHPKYRTSGSSDMNALTPSTGAPTPTLFAHTKRMVYEEEMSWPGSTSTSNEELLSPSSSYYRETAMESEDRQKPIVPAPTARGSKNRSSMDTKILFSAMARNGNEGEGRRQQSGQTFPGHIFTSEETVLESSSPAPTTEQQQASVQAPTPKTSNVVSIIDHTAVVQRADQPYHQVLDPVEQFRQPYKVMDTEKDPVDTTMTSIVYQHHGEADLNLVFSDLSATTPGVPFDPKTTPGMTGGAKGTEWNGLCRPETTIVATRGQNYGPTSAFASKTVACLLYPSVVPNACVPENATNNRTTTATGGTTMNASTASIPQEVPGSRMNSNIANLLDNDDDDDDSVMEKEEIIQDVDTLFSSFSKSSAPAVEVSASQEEVALRRLLGSNQNANQVQHDSPIASSILDRDDDRQWMNQNDNDSFDQAARIGLSSNTLFRNAISGTKPKDIVHQEKSISMIGEQEGSDRPSPIVPRSLSKSRRRSAGSQPQRNLARNDGTGSTTPYMARSSLEKKSTTVEIFNSKTQLPLDQYAPHWHSEATPKSKSNLRSTSTSPTPAMTISEDPGIVSQQLLIEHVEQNLKFVQDRVEPDGSVADPRRKRLNDRSTYDSTKHKGEMLHEILKTEPTLEIQTRRQEQQEFRTMPLLLVLPHNVNSVQRRHEVDDAKVDILHLNNKSISIGKIQDFKVSPYHSMHNSTKAPHQNKLDVNRWGWFGRKKNVEDPMVGAKAGLTLKATASSVQSGITSEETSATTKPDRRAILILGDRKRMENDATMSNQQHNQKLFESAAQEEKMASVSGMGRNDSTDSYSHGDSCNSNADNKLQRSITFDAIIKDLQMFESQLPNAEFAVVEMGEDSDTIPAHSFLMNKQSLEKELISGNENSMVATNMPYGLPPISERSSEAHSVPSAAPERQFKALDDFDMENLNVSGSFADKIDQLKKIQETLKMSLSTNRRLSLRKR